MDGLGAAAAYYLYNPNAIFVPCQYGKEQNKIIDWLCSGAIDPDIAEIVIVDFSFNQKHFARLWKSNYTERQIRIIDHHKTAKEELIDTEFFKYAETVFFDIEHSGAFLTWRYFHGLDGMPEIIKYIEDRDLCRFKYPQTKSIHTWLQYSEYTVKEFAIALQKLSFEQIEAEAHAMQCYRGFATDHHVKNMWPAVFYADDEMNVIVIMVNCSPLFASETAHDALNKWNDEHDAKNQAMFACAYTLDSENAYLSLRSDNEHWDVSLIAKDFGGGGHRNAADCRMKSLDFIELFEKLETPEKMEEVG